MKFILLIFALSSVLANANIPSHHSIRDRIEDFLKEVAEMPNTTAIALKNQTDEILASLVHFKATPEIDEQCPVPKHKINATVCRIKNIINDCNTAVTNTSSGFITFIEASTKRLIKKGGALLQSYHKCDFPTNDKIRILCFTGLTLLADWYLKNTQEFKEEAKKGFDAVIGTAESCTDRAAQLIFTEMDITYGNFSYCIMNNVFKE